MYIYMDRKRDSEKERDVYIDKDGWKQEGMKEIFQPKLIQFKLIKAKFCPFVARDYGGC